MKRAEYYAIICASGFNTPFKPHFPLVGVDLSDK